MNKRKGFSLIELLIVVASILIIAAIAMPNLLWSRMAANEASFAPLPCASGLYGTDLRFRLQLRLQRRLGQARPACSRNRTELAKVRSISYDRTMTIQNGRKLMHLSEAATSRIWVRVRR